MLQDLLSLFGFTQAYVAKMYKDGDFVKVSGIVQERSEQIFTFKSKY